MRGQYSIGIDLGATKTLAVGCDLDGNILLERKIDTPRNAGRDITISTVLSLIDEIRCSSSLEDRQVLGVGIGYPGVVSYKTGIVHNSIMLPGWVEVPLQAMIEQYTNLPARIDNDANAAAFAEYWVGAGQGASTLVCLTLGTGIGGGLIINRALYRGPDETAGEFGNMSIDYDGPLCDCGNRGCLNPLASGTAITMRARESIRQEGGSRILELANGDVDRITTEMVAQAAFEGDQLANRLLSETAVYLGAGIANLVNALNPDVVVLGGGVAEIGDLLIRKIQTEVEWRAFKMPAKRARILRAALGVRAGAVGAAGILIKALQNS